MVIKDIIQKALMSQSTSKAPGPDKINFRILRMIWEWDSERLIAMVKNTIRLGYQPQIEENSRYLTRKNGKARFWLC